MSPDRLPGRDLGRLGFIQLAQAAFEFLLQMDFRVVERESTRLRYESPTVFVSVYHGRSSYQVGLEIGRANDREKYSLHELLTAAAPTEVEKARCQATNREGLNRCLAAIADVVQRTCRSVLKGDPAAFEDLRSAVAPARKVKTLQAQFGAILDCADQAWEAKDLRRATELYQRARPALDKTRLRRIEYLLSRKEEEGW
jgi:hypothetical protein